MESDWLWWGMAPDQRSSSSSAGSSTGGREDLRAFEANFWA